MDCELDGKVAVVTGAASGIGRATALRLGVLGASLAIVDRDAAGLASLAGEIGKPVLTIACDLAGPGGVGTIVDRCVTALGGLDILVNGAGIDVGQADLIDLTGEAWAMSYAVNLHAPMLLMQAAARYWIGRGAAGKTGGGRIVNVTSSSAFRAGKGMAAYASAKAALTQLTRNAAAELGPHGINVNAVAPGTTATPLALGWFETREAMAAAAQPGGPVANLLHSLAEPEDVAAAIVFLCLPESRQITGQTIHTSGGTIV